MNLIIAKPLLSSKALPTGIGRGALFGNPSSTLDQTNPDATFPRAADGRRGCAELYSCNYEEDEP